ncbi:outer dynein arm-docking complex subunit 3-like isoform X2 [Halichondria panicea]|uniref:outer dynein arm-docking complex subunit 3-like isoform X2 n=1 Tax=Halichondria panicea TaxID=6063 RepID=UPI00312B7612
MSSNVTDEIDELKRRIALIDGDRKAYSESSQWAIKQNKELIAQLRAENKQIRTKLSNRMKADDDVVGDVFQAHNTSIPAELHGLTGEAALKKFDQTICEMIKKRNALHHVKRSREKTLSHLEMQISHMDMEEEMILSTPAGDSEEAKQLRQLENRLDKAVIKNNEASHIRKTYEVILQKLQEERLGFDREIADLEKAIKTRSKDLKELENMCNDAQLARDMAKAELSRQEQSMTESRRERDKVLAEYRKQANEKKDFAEKVDRRLRRTSVAQSVGLSAIGQTNTAQEVQEAKISSYEEALAKIKDATGVSDIQEVVDRFLNQGDTKRHLEQLREENTKVVSRLKEEREKLQAQFEDLKYSGEAKMSTGQRMLEEFQGHLDDAKRKCAESESKTKSANKLLGQVNNGVEHLTEKMQHIKAPHSHALYQHIPPNLCIASLSCPVPTHTP